MSEESPSTLHTSIPRDVLPDARHYLTVFQGVAVERSFEVVQEPYVLGRDTSRPFHLPDPEISRAHCEVRLSGGTVLVRDLDSTNGTFIDGRRVEGEQALAVSSLLQLGTHALRHELLTPAEVDRHEQLASDLRRARRYVEALIPAPIEAGPVRARWCFVPSEILGGDGLGYHELDENHFALYVIDVCGHGVGAAMHSASVLNVLRNRTLAADFGNPGAVLGALNSAFHMDEHGGLYVTAWYGVLDVTSGQLRYSTAGHPPAIVVGPDGKPRARLSVKNPPIGVLAERTFGQAETVLDPGSLLYVFTDGAYEVVQPRDEEGAPAEGTLADLEAELTASERTAPDPREVYRDVLAASGTEHLEDDFTLLALSFKGLQRSDEDTAKRGA